MFKFSVAAAALAASMIFAQAPARAASPMSEAFMANVAANLAILDTSSHLAPGGTRNTDLIAYAKSEADEAVQVATALREAAPADHGVASAGGPLLTGRSVAVAGMTGRIEAVPQVSALEASDAQTSATVALTALTTLRGRAFDKLFFVTQLAALSQIESDYRAYIKEGDDPAIATMARQQLPALMKRLEALARV